MDGVRALASFGPRATLFTLGPNHTVQQYDVSHRGLVKSAQYLPMLPPPVPLKAGSTMPESLSHQMPGTAPPMPISHGSDSARGPVPLSTIQRSANDMLAVENSRLHRPEVSSPGSMSSRSVTESASSISSNPPYPPTNPSISSRAASGTTFSTFSPSMIGRDSMFSGGSSGFPHTQSASRVSSGRRSRGSRLRQEVLRSPDSSYVDLFPRARARLSTVIYKQRPLDQDNLGPDELRKQMLEVVFGWDHDIEPLVRDELAHHEKGSTSAVLLSKWLGEVDADSMAAAMVSGSISSSDWMLLALNSIGGQASMKKMGQAMVQKLLQQGDFHTSATILLGLGDREDAVEVYVSRSFYMEAILLTCLIFPSDWQRQAHLVRRWGEFVVENSQQQLAIRCFSCTGVDPPIPWASPSLGSQSSTVSQGTPSISSMLSPPVSPPPLARTSGSVRMTNKNASLKLITSFAAPEKAHFKFPGLKSDDRTPTNGPSVTPIAESALSPGGTPVGFGRSSQTRSKSNLVPRTATPGGYYKHRLPSIGETPIDVSMPLFPRPNSLPTPDHSGSEPEKEKNASVYPSRDEAAKSLDGLATQGAEPEPPLLLSSARYDPRSGPPGRSPMTALLAASDSVSHMPSPAQDTFTAFAEKSRARNGSRDRKPDGLHILPPHAQVTSDYLSSGGLGSGNSDHRRSNPLSSLRSSGSHSARLDARSGNKSPSVSGQSLASGKSPSISSRSIDQYISSLGEAGYHDRRRKSTSRRRHASREGRPQTGEHKSRSKQRALDRSEDRGRGNQKYIRPAKRSPSSPVPMSPDEIHLYQDNSSNSNSIHAQLLAGTSSPGPVGGQRRESSSRPKGVAGLRSGSKASDFSNRTAVRTRSREGIPDSQLGSEASFLSGSLTGNRLESAIASRPDSPDASVDASDRGRGKSKDHGSVMRSPSSPLPMSPQLHLYQRSDDEEDRLRFVDANRQRIRSRNRSSSRKPRERGTSTRRDKSPDRRRVKESHKPRSVQGSNSNNPTKGLQQPQSAVEPTFATEDQFAQALARLGQKSDRMDTDQKKALAALELEARRESLARRPSAPAIPHPTELTNSRPPLVVRSHTDLGNSPTSWNHPNVSPQHHHQRFAAGSSSPSPDPGDYSNRTAASSTTGGPYGLPATPRAMRHPKYDAGQYDKIPSVPEVPEGGSPPLPPPPPIMMSDMFSTGQSMREFPRSMSAPIPEAQPPPAAPPELPPHPAFHKALRSNVKRPNFSPLDEIGQHRRKPSVDTNVIGGPPMPVGIDEQLHAADPLISIISAAAPVTEQPPLLPELQHLSSAIPPPPPPPPVFPNEVLAHHSASSGGNGSGLGVINIAIDEAPRNDPHVIDVPTMLSPHDARSPPPSTERSTPATVVRSNSNHRRGRSENFKNNIKGITDRLRSTSRGRNNTKSPHMEQTGNGPSPYESVPPLYF